MNRLLERVASFRAHAQKSTVKVNVHGAGSAALMRNASVARLVVFASLLSAGAGMGLSELTHQQLNAKHTYDKSIEAPAPNAEPADSGMQLKNAEPTLKYVQVNHRGRDIMTLDEASRIILSKQAAQKTQLRDVGLTWKDLFGVIHAETAWIPRDGMGKNGVVSSGLGQFEPATAKSLNLTDPNDPIQAVHASAVLMREAAGWARSRLRGLDLNPKEKSAKVREGVSIYYNLSSKGRALWDGTNASDLPVETQHHIRNTKDGAMLAASLEKHLKRNGVITDIPVQETGYLRASYGGQLHGGAPSVTTYVQDLVQAAARFHSTAAALQSQLDRTCDLKALGSAIEMTHACLKADPLISSGASAIELHALFPKMTLAGSIDGTPVFISRTQTLNAAAMGNVQHDGRLVSGIVLTEGLVQAAQGPELAARLAFIVGHELSHIDERHSSVTWSEVQRHEHEADIGAIDYMRNKGFSDSEIASAANFAMSAVRAEHTGDSANLADVRENAIAQTLFPAQRMERVERVERAFVQR